MKNAGDGKVCARQVGGKQISQMRGPKGKCELSLVGITILLYNGQIHGRMQSNIHM